jgi:two-component system phosphate regulon response regulator PhoB
MLPMMHRTILLVSADPYYSRPIQNCLVEAGYQVLTSERGGRALEIMRIKKPGLVVLDWKLPDLSGLAIIRIIRADERMSKLPIILVGRQLRDEDRLISLETGADLCLAETFQPKVFIARVRALLRRAYSPELV